jgi:uncharacterized membrane protein YphA (DoxX/SURF4 family)
MGITELPAPPLLSLLGGLEEEFKERPNLSQLFSIFPGGCSAFGLLLLRFAVGLTAAAQGWAYFAGNDNPPPWMWAAGLLALLDGAALVVGFLTPAASAVTALGAIGTVASWFPAPTPNLFDAMLPTYLVIVVAVAILLLGPGSLSVDARLFGLREITIPRTITPT